MVITKRGKWGTIWSWTAILSLAIAQRHLAICNLIFKQIQDIHLLHKLGNSVPQQAILFNHRAMHCCMKCPQILREKTSSQKSHGIALDF